LFRTPPEYYWRQNGIDGEKPKREITNGYTHKNEEHRSGIGKDAISRAVKKSKGQKPE
jgi:hypothetical protein